MTRRFEVIPEGDDWEEAKTVSAYDHEEAVYDLCDYYWSHCDGWEWMRDGCRFLVRPTEEPEDVRVVGVDVDFAPTFLAMEINRA